MRKILAAALATLALSTANIIAASNNPVPASSGDKVAPAPAGEVRKLSRRERKDAIARLADNYRLFLKEVEPIILDTEINAFLLLESDAQRDRYIEDFWHRRDPDPKTAYNEYREGYSERLEEAKKKFKHLISDRARIYLIQGAPTAILETDCAHNFVPMQLWTYPHIPTIGHDVVLLFYMPRSVGDYKLFVPRSSSGEDFKELHSPEAEANRANPVAEVLAARSSGELGINCKNAELLQRALFQTLQNRVDLPKLFDPPKIDQEDVNRILRATVISDPAAKKFPAEASTRFPGKRGSRIAAEFTLLIPRAELTVKDLGKGSYYNVDVTGEVLKDGKLFEAFRYRYDYPAENASEKLPIVFERFLQPAEYQARIKVTDANAAAEAIIETPLSVPYLTEAPERVAAARAADQAIEQLHTEIQTGDDQIRIVPFPDDLLTGLQHIETIVVGDRIKGVEFYLDGKKVMVKRSGPFTLDLDFGDVPQPRKIKVVGLDEKNQFVSGDEVIVNTGREPFRVRIVSPRVAMNLKGRVRVEIEAAAPEGKKLRHVELFYNETRLATLYEPPWVQTITIPDNAAIGYLRAVATLDDQNVQPVEDVVFVNTPEYLEQVQVHLVELPTTVTAGSGRHLNDLPQTAFKILDEGRAVEIAKFEKVRNLPLAIGMAMDTSGSMRNRMLEAQKSGVAFFEGVMKQGDKAFLVGFDTQPLLVQKWTSSISDLRGGIASMRAEEATALYDAIVYSLHNFKGVKGQRALVVLSDGRDTASKFKFEQALEFSKRSGIPIYIIGIGIKSTDVDVRFKMSRFAAETGGAVYHIANVSDLDRIYKSIQEELRSQYLIGFYPPGDVKPGSKWREVTVQVSEGKAKTIRGYYP